MLQPEPPVALDLSKLIIGEGKAVLVMPCKNPTMAPVLTVTGHPLGDGAIWILSVKDTFGTPLWSVELTGRERATDDP